MAGTKELTQFTLTQGEFKERTAKSSQNFLSFASTSPILGGETAGYGAVHVEVLKKALGLPESATMEQVAGMLVKGDVIVTFKLYEPVKREGKVDEAKNIF